MAALATSCVPISAPPAPCFPNTSATQAESKSLFRVKQIQRKTANLWIFARSQPFATRKLQLRVTRKSLHSISPKTRTNGKRSASLLCTAALDATCSATQTLPQVQKGKTKTLVSPLASFKPPQLDQSGRGHPPGGGGGGGGGGSGGGGSGEAGWGWWFGLFCIVFLYLISAVEDKESEKGDYRE